MLRDDTNTMSVETANAVYDALVEHGRAREDRREQFVYDHTTGFLREDGVVIALGSGGKFRRNRGMRPDGTFGEHWYVDGYQEHYTPERRAVIATLNPILDTLRARHEAEQATA